MKGDDHSNKYGKPRNLISNYESHKSNLNISTMLARLNKVDQQQQKRRTKDYVPLLLNGKVVLGFLDSGNNLPGIAMSLNHYVSMGLNPHDLIRNPKLTKVATAKAGSSLEICGTTKKPLSFQFGGSQKKFKFHR